MAIQKINLGTEPHGVGGDSYRTANDKINKNFEEVSTNITNVDEKYSNTEVKITEEVARAKQVEDELKTSLEKESSRAVSAEADILGVVESESKARSAENIRINEAQTQLKTFVDSEVEKLKLEDASIKTGLENTHRYAVMSQTLGLSSKFYDKDGQPLSGGKVHTYEAGTSTPSDTYKDLEFSIPNTNPIILDETGSADVFLKGTYRFRIFDKNDTFVEEQESVNQPATLNSIDNFSKSVESYKQEVNSSLEYLKEKTQIVESVADLLTVKNPKDRLRVYVSSIPAYYTFNAQSIEQSNGVTVVSSGGGAWIMEDKPSYFASWFANANVEIDQSLKLQAGLDYATKKGASFIIDDTYWVKANQVLLGTKANALILRTNSVTIFTPKGHLKLITENTSGYNMILARQIDNYVLIRPRLTGDRRTNKVGSGEWGYGLTIYESSNGYIERPYIRDMWGDGLYIGKAWATTSNDVPTNITVIEPNIKGCRRNGLSLTSWDNVRIVRPIISNVGDYDGIAGTFPKAAIDVEPEFAEGNPPARGINGLIEDPILLDSYAGFFFYGFHDNSNFDLHIKGITTLKGISTTGTGFFHGGANCTGLIKIDHLNYLTAPHSGMSLGWNKLSKLKLLIERIDYPEGGSLVIASGLNGAFVGKRLGNVTINNINTSGFTVYAPPKDEEYLIDGYRFFISPDNKVGIGTYVEGTSADLGGKDTYISSSLRPAYAGWSTVTNNLGNEIWLNTYSNPAGDTQIVFVTTTDYRVLTIGLSNNTFNIGQGCNISGVKLTVNGVAVTRMGTKTKGGWIKFQNIEGKDTVIYDSYGEWAFF